MKIIKNFLKYEFIFRWSFTGFVAINFLYASYRGDLSYCLGIITGGSVVFLQSGSKIHKLERAHYHIIKEVLCVFSSPAVNIVEKMISIVHISESSLGKNTQIYDDLSDLMLKDKLVNGECIQCPVCKMVSYNSGDIKNEYCLNCDKYHVDMKDSVH